MSNYSILPASHAEAVIMPLVIDKTINYTFIESIDETELYKDLDKRLMKLEIVLTIDEETLLQLIHDSKEFRFLVEEKEEILMRIDWLKRLGQVQQSLSDVQTKEEAQKQMRLISSCQTSPLKNQLTTQLDHLIQSLSSESNETIQASEDEKLMEKAIEEAGDAFINLASSGREYVISDVIQQYGDKATIKAIQEHTVVLEQRVVSLADVKGQAELIQQLERLQMASFSSLSIKRKEQIAERLLEVGKWSGIASLERLILQLNRLFTHEEQEQEAAAYTIHTLDGKAALTLDIKDVVDGRVQLG